MGKRHLTMISGAGESSGRGLFSCLRRLLPILKGTGPEVEGKSEEEKISPEEMEKVIQAMEGRTENLILIGMPGCGKSTVGRELAQRLGRPLVDLDQEIEREAGVPIPQIFAEQGEEAFRQMEHRQLVKASRRSGVVIATGGGVVTRKENLKPMRENAVVVFLRRDLELLPKEGRPVSQREGLEKLYRKRLPLYKKAADLDVYNATVKEAAAEIIRKVSHREKRAGK